MRGLFGTLDRIFGVIYFFSRGGSLAARRLGVTVGNDCRIYIKNFGSEPFLITIGNRTTITSGVRILTHDGSTGLVRNEAGRRYQNYGPVRIGDDVFIGVNAIILPGVTIHSRSIIAAGAVVTRNVAEGDIVGGNPARVIGSVDAYQKKVRATCPNDEDLQGLKSYRERVALAVEIAERRKMMWSGDVS